MATAAPDGREERAEAPIDPAVYAAVGALVNLSNLPEWMQAPAWGRDVRPIAQLAVDAARPVILTEARRADALRDLLADEDLAVKRLRFAIADPGSFLPRGDNYAEPITLWSARAVLAALREVGPDDRMA